MSFHVLPFGRDVAPTELAPARLPERSTQGASPMPADNSFAKVYDYSVFEAARAAKRSREMQIPPHVMDEVQAAARLYEDLQAADRQVRFDTHRLNGRVVAELCDNEGNVVRPISLSEIVDYGDPDTAA